MIKVGTCGTFDCFHKGHLNFLKKAKEMGDYLIVGVCSDEFDIRRGKTEKRDSLQTRIQNVLNTGLADEVVVEDSDEWKQNIVNEKGIDIWCSSEEFKGKFDYLNCKVVYLPRTKGISSTDIRKEKMFSNTFFPNFNISQSQNFRDVDIEGGSFKRKGIFRDVEIEGRIFKKKEIIKGANITSENIEKAKENLLIFKEVADENNLKFILCFGTLLGCMREHSFIDNDDDIDTVILEEDFEKYLDMIPKLIERGFEIYNYIKNFKLIRIIKDGITIDAFTASNTDKGYKVHSGIVPFEFFDNLKEVEFFGKPFKVPEKAEEFLSLHYGEDWKIPNPKNKGTYMRFEKLLLM